MAYSRLATAHLSSDRTRRGFRFRRNVVPGFPFGSEQPHTISTIGSDLRSASGLPEFSSVSLPACHGLRTPVDLHILAKTDASVLPSVNVKTLGVHNFPFRSCTSTSGCATIPTAYRILCLRLACLVRESRIRSTPPQAQDSIRVGS